MSVNDVFVMGAWGKDQDVGEEVMLLADGNGEFTKALGLEMDGSKFGMGLRSQRYSMLVEDGRVEQLNVEQGGEFRVSSADTCSIRLTVSQRADRGRGGAESRRPAAQPVVDRFA